MNDTTFNAAATASICFDGYDEQGYASTTTLLNMIKKEEKGEQADYNFKVWDFDIIDHYRTLLRDEFGILSLESRLEELNIQDDDNLHMFIYTPKLLALIGEAIGQELELAGGLCLWARKDTGKVVVFYQKIDADKLALLDEKKDVILARADYLGVLDLVDVWTSKKKAA